MFTLHYSGYNYIEDNKFIINRPEGASDYLFLFFSTPINILIDNEIIRTQPNAMVLFEPKCPQYYFDPDNGFVNDWFHFDCNDSKKNPILTTLPHNRIFYIDSCDFVRDVIRELEREDKLKELFYEENIHARITELFIHISRASLHQHNTLSNVYMNSMKIEFRELRSRILTHYQHPWSTDEMAAEVKLSRSRFCVLYKTFFNISPKDDLLTERFKMAQHLLLTTQLSVEEVSSKVGYSNLYHFSKQFKRVTGSSPSRFRQINSL